MRQPTSPVMSRRKRSVKSSCSVGLDKKGQVGCRALSQARAGQSRLKEPEPILVCDGRCAGRQRRGRRQQRGLEKSPDPPSRRNPTLGGSLHRLCRLSPASTLACMPRRPRLQLATTPLHVIQRGVNRCTIFVDDLATASFAFSLPDKDRINPRRTGSQLPAKATQSRRKSAL